MRKLLAAALLAGVAMPYAPAAYAQDAADEAASSGEIIVTARRREENLVGRADRHHRDQRRGSRQSARSPTRTTCSRRFRAWSSARTAAPTVQLLDPRPERRYLHQLAAVGAALYQRSADRHALGLDVLRHGRHPGAQGAAGHAVRPQRHRRRDPVLDRASRRTSSAAISSRPRRQLTAFDRSKARSTCRASDIGQAARRGSHKDGGGL